MTELQSRTEGFLLERVPTFDELARVLGQVLVLPLEQIVQLDYDKLPDPPVQALVETNTLPGCSGSFMFDVTLYLRVPAVAPQGRTLAAAVARGLGCRVLCSPSPAEGGPNEWWLLTPQGEAHHAWQTNPEAEDRAIEVSVRR